MRELVVGLTGPTGAGKSTWTAAFRQLGCAVIDCDALAHRVTEEPAVLRALQRTFGTDLIQNGRLNRRLLAHRAFANAVATGQLNAITHPAIRADIAREMERCAAQTPCAVIIDAPLLFEGGLETLCTLTAAVLAPPEVRLKRIMVRDGITREEALQRMASQHSDDFFRQRADTILSGALLPEQVPENAQRQLAVWLGEST